MKLSEIILENERNKQNQKNKELVRIRLKELVYAFPTEVLQVLHSTGVAVSSLLPSSVLYAIVIKHVPHNSELREAISKMLLEMDTYASADGSGAGWQLVGGSLSAIGSVLTGIGRSQGEQSVNSEANDKIEQAQKQAELEKEQAKRTTKLVIGISAIVILGLIIGFSFFRSAKPKLQTS